MRILAPSLQCGLNIRVDIQVRASAGGFRVPCHYETEQAAGTEKIFIQSIEGFVLTGA